MRAEPLRRFLVALTMLAPSVAGACDAPVCVVAPETVRLARIITFDDQPGTMGPGRLLPGNLVLPGASFGERFAGQAQTAATGFDLIAGAAAAPLALAETDRAHLLTISRVGRATLLNGLGPTGYPRDDATGEGAIAILFDRDQAAIRLDLRGGEGGTGTVQVLARDGRAIATVTLAPLGETGFGLVRQGNVADIAGVVLGNDDPAGIALDAVAFDGDEITS